MRPVLLLTLLILSGCGQIGPLYLPASGDTSVTEAAPESNDVSSDDAKESVDDPTDALQ